MNFWNTPPDGMNTVCPLLKINESGWMGELNLFPESHTELSCLLGKYLTHWARVTQTCISILTIIGSDNVLSTGRQQAITRTNADYCQLDSWEYISVKFESEFYHFHSRKSIVKCHLKSGGHLVSASMCLLWFETDCNFHICYGFCLIITLLKIRQLYIITVMSHSIMVFHIISNSIN